ncbi:mitogen-activated protein kinase 20-like isoform X2 [Quercus robur]|uniref:mitogen-activated protein kinase 20-like isoform X2 n=1 Tax=Quercus robur TaxID=38942 RepID=UPI0021632D3D|nr:mitogen-activated protein kinase 20-like isoform X2 [Quercus robur]
MYSNFVPDMQKLGDFKLPHFFNYPPYFILQPVRDTREKQVQCWKDLILDYCRTQKIFVIGLEEDFLLFSNSAIETFFWHVWIWRTYCIYASGENSTEMDFFSEYGDANKYKIQEVIGKGSYGVVCSAIDTCAGEKMAIKKIHDIFEHISDAARILHEIKLLRLLQHPGIVEIIHIMLPPSRRDFKDIYVVFELMESDLHQVIKANDDLTREHYQFFLYQLLRALKYIHTGKVNGVIMSHCRLPQIGLVSRYF